ncbi:DUF362 domain-containing protein [Candidatus Woesearchaeota archaeon]|nr:DUF362 domain-containing protein [Candidatus Woesearchaeota archaeon]
MNNVVFIEDEKKLQSVLKNQLIDAGFVKPGDRIAVKMHFGEPGNKTALKPPVVKKVVNALKELGAKPFLFDSLVVYHSPRNNVEGHLEVAAKQGFTEESMGCEIVVSDEHIVKRGIINYEICKELVDADGVLVLTHLKGHICTGFGGAIKNLGMGAVSRATKNAIHKGGEPEYVEGCTLCNVCSARCPVDNIRYDDSRPHYDKNWCCGCSNCVIFCPEKASKTKVESFDLLLSEAAAFALKNFKKAYHVNVLKNITRKCDCESNPGEIVVPDIGILMGQDLISVEKASHDLVIEKAGKDVFREIHGKSPLVHIKIAQKLGIGSMDYKLVKM